jgi:hypothetical protein
VRFTLFAAIIMIGGFLAARASIAAEISDGPLPDVPCGWQVGVVGHELALVPGGVRCKPLTLPLPTATAPMTVAPAEPADPTARLHELERAEDERAREILSEAGQRVLRNEVDELRQRALDAAAARVNRERDLEIQLRQLHNQVEQARDLADYCAIVGCR